MVHPSSLKQIHECTDTYSSIVSLKNHKFSLDREWAIQQIDIHDYLQTVGSFKEEKKSLLFF